MSEKKPANQHRTTPQSVMAAEGAALAWNSRLDALPPPELSEWDHEMIGHAMDEACDATRSKVGGKTTLLTVSPRVLIEKLFERGLAIVRVKP